MSKYIDADEIRKRLFSYYDCVNESTAKGNYRGETLMNYEVAQMIEDCIEETPTADVQEVKHGKWFRTVPTTTKSYRRICSLCGKIAYMIRARYIYCPWCGAKMYGGESK